MQFQLPVGLLLLLLTSNTYAYVGPGLGLGIIGTILGILLAMLLAIVGVVWYPLKRIFKKNTNKQARSHNTEKE